MKAKPELKKIYIIPSQYMSLIVKEDFAKPSFMAFKTGKIIRPRVITASSIKTTINDSKNEMLAFETLEAAQSTVDIALEGHNTSWQFIQGFLPYFAVPIIVTAHVPKDLTIKNKQLSGEIAFNYFETKTIPLHSSGYDCFIRDYVEGPEKDRFVKKNKEEKIELINCRIKELSSCPQVFTINRNELGSNLKLQEGTYLNGYVFNTIELPSNKIFETFQTARCTLFPKKCVEERYQHYKSMSNLSPTGRE